MTPAVERRMARAKDFILLIAGGFVWGLADWLKVDLDDVMVCLLGWIRGDRDSEDEHVVLRALELLSLYVNHSSVRPLRRRIIKRFHGVQGHFGLAVVAMRPCRMHLASNSAES